MAFFQLSHLWIFFGGIIFGGLAHLVAFLIKRKIEGEHPQATIKILLPKDTKNHGVKSD